MADVMAIVSKAVFDKDARVAGRPALLGDVWPVDRYKSTNKAFESLGADGRIFLVTVRPPDEHLWLVGVVSGCKLTDGSYVGAPNRAPVTDITSLRKAIKFESGKGMSQDKGALGMSLQTPRAMAPADAQAILALVPALSGAAPAAHAAAPVAVAPAPPPPPAEPSLPKASPATRTALEAHKKQPKDALLREAALRGLVLDGELEEAERVAAGLAHLNAHDVTGLPCLCRACWKTAPKETSARGTGRAEMVFHKDLVLDGSKLLFFWAPAELIADEGPRLEKAVRVSLRNRMDRLAHEAKLRLRARPEPRF
ncbi:MAG: hypothetical protein U0271_46530 [Polyangiaceae bacterium]